jgi:opacity protein-like surface antigen
MKKFLFTAILALSLTFTTSAATATEATPIQSIELTENMVINTYGETLNDEDCDYIGVYDVFVDGVYIGRYDVYICR